MTAEKVESDNEFKIPGTPVLTIFGGGVLLSYREEDGMHEVRLWSARGGGSATAFLTKSAIIRKMRAAIGFVVSTPMGRGVVTSIRHANSPCYKIEGEAAATNNKDSDIESKSDKIEALDQTGDIYCVEFTNWTLSTNKHALGYFSEESVQCTGAIVLPVVELLTNQATLFLQWSAKSMSGIVGEFSKAGDGSVDTFSFLDKLQQGMLGSGDLLAQKFEASGGEEAINNRLETSRTAANEILNEMKDAEKVEVRIKTLLDDARRRVKELTVMADPQAKKLTSEFVDIANQTLTSENQQGGGEGVGIDEIAAKYTSIEKFAHDKEKIAEIMHNSKDQFSKFINLDENGKAISQKLGLDELKKTSDQLDAAKKSISDVLRPSLRAAVEVTNSTLKKKSEGGAENNKGENGEVDTVDDGSGKDKEAKELEEAMKLAEEFANKEMDLAKHKLEDAKKQVEDRVLALNGEVNDTLKTLRELALKDERLGSILAGLESEGGQLTKVREKVASSKALTEALKGREMISRRVSKLLEAPEVDTLKETGMRIGARFMDKDSAARKKSDQLMRAVTARLQSKLLGVKQHADDPNKSISGFYDLFNVDALLESVEGDLIKFLMNQREYLVDKATPLAMAGDGPIKWDPRIQFMVSFIKDCAKVSLREQLEKGFDGLKDRLSKPSAFKVPQLAIKRLETALLDLFDSAGGAISLGDLSNFWNFLQKGHTVESAAKEALALLPEEKAVEEFSQKSLTFALMKFGGSVPPSLKKMLLEESGAASGDGDGSMLTMSSAGGGGLSRQSLWQQFRSGNMEEVLDGGVGYLNSDSVVDTVQKLVGESSGFLSAIESMREDTRIQVAMATLGSKDMEDKLMAGIESIDVAELMGDAELAATDQAARQRLVDGMKNACLEFLLQYLPSMPIPPIEGEEDGLEYGVSNMDLSRFKLKKEDVEVKLGDLAKLSAAALNKKDDAAAAASPAAAAAATTAVGKGQPTVKKSTSSGSLKKSGSSSSLKQAPDVSVKTEELPDSTILTVTARNISAEFVKLHWSYKQRYFPYLEGGGSCDAVVTGCSISISFEVRRDFRKKRQAKKAPSKDAKDSAQAADTVHSSGSSTGASTKKNMSSGSEGGSVMSALIDVASGGTIDTQSGTLGEVLNSFSSRGGKKASPLAAAPSLLWEPVMVLGACHVTIDDLSMRMSGDGSGHGSMAWLYNILASLFRQQIREYIITSLSDSIMENAEGLLGTFNGFVRSSWPVLSAATNANLDSLPLLNHSIAAGQVAELQRRTSGGKIVNITLNQPGPLGLHLDINSKRGVIRFTSPVKGGQAEASCQEQEAKLGLSQESTANHGKVEESAAGNKDVKKPHEIGSALKGAYLTKINNVSVGGISVSDTLVMLKSTERPLVLSFVLPAMKKAAHHHKKHGHSHGGASGGDGGHGKGNEKHGDGLETVVVSFTTASLGLKIKQLINLPHLVTVIGFARDPETNEMLPAEASNKIKVGMLLLRVNDSPLWGEGFKEVAVKLKVCATAAAQGGPPLMLTFAEPPDLSVQFPSNPTDLMLSIARTDGHETKDQKKGQSNEQGKFGVVVSGFKMNEMGPVQASGLVLEGDTLVGCNGSYFPIGGNYRDYVASLKDQTYPLNLEFEGLRETNSPNLKEQYQKKFIQLKIEDNPSKKLGVVFGCGDGGLPVIRRFEYVPGVAARYDGVQPGMLLLQVGKVPIDPDVINAAHKQVSDKAAATNSAVSNGTATVYETVNHPVPVETIQNLLNESSFPSTVVRFRDMDKYLKIKSFASSTSKK